MKLKIKNEFNYTILKYLFKNKKVIKRNQYR